ncbi:MAG: CoA transferase [Rhodococcus sp. (in: high G+C Gram-positive bacteria)]|uniref:CoA transferase n=1 Tax=Rhodococcus sp. TaxID=1831 RepID=UPI003BAECA3F
MTNILGGVRVVSLAGNLPGPVAAARLTALGASVTKVEPPSGDALAAAAAEWYAELTADQQVLVLDLKAPADREKLDVELAGADLLITAMRPSALRRLGLADAHLTYPGLSHVEIVGYDGEFEELPGHDLNYQAAHGTVQPPTMPTVPIADLLGAERSVSAALLVLLEKTSTGTGGHRRVVLDDAARDAGAAVRHGLMGVGAPLGGAIPTYGIYGSADGYVALGALEPHFSARIRDALGIEGTREELERTFATRDTAYWEEIGERADIPLTGIRIPTRGDEK